MTEQTVRILIPTDFSEASLKAVHYASRLAHQIVAEITLFHATGLPIISTAQELEAVAAIDLERIESEQLQQLAQKMQRLYPKMKFLTLMANGFPIQEISQIAKNGQTDLIIMGTRGANGLKELLVGSNTASLIQRTEVPVMAVPEKAEFNSLSKIVFACNLLADDVHSIREIIRLFGKLNPEITLLHIDDGHNKDAEKEMKNWFDQYVAPSIDYPSLKMQTISDSDIVRALDKYISVQGSNILVTATRKRNFFDRIFDRSITKKLAYHTHVPLLALHAHTSKGEMVF